MWSVRCERAVTMETVELLTNHRWELNSVMVHDYELEINQSLELYFRGGTCTVHLCSSFLISFPQDDDGEDDDDDDIWWADAIRVLPCAFEAFLSSYGIYRLTMALKEREMGMEGRAGRSDHCSSIDSQCGCGICKNGLLMDDLLEMAIHGNLSHCNATELSCLVLLVVVFLFLILWTLC